MDKLQCIQKCNIIQMNELGVLAWVCLNQYGTR